MANASSLLNVRKIWILAVQLTLMLFRYIAMAAMKRNIHYLKINMEHINQAIKMVYTYCNQADKILSQKAY